VLRSAAEAAKLEGMIRTNRMSKPVARLAMSVLGPLLVAASLASCGVVPRSAATLNHSGNQQYRAGDYANALESYREAEVLRPDLPALNYNAGNALIQQSGLQQAINEDQQAARSTDPTTQDHAYYSMGDAYVGLNDLADAVEAYKSALRANPSDVDAKYNLEVIERRLEQEQANQPAPGGQAAQSQPGQSAQGEPGQQGEQVAAGQGGQSVQAGQSTPGVQAAQGGQPANIAQGAPSAGAAIGAPGGSTGSASGYTGTPAGQAAALDPSLQQALGQFDKTGSVDSALQALDIIAQQERLQQSGNSPPPDPQGKDW
jgi:Ca-activated chloride channel family protein